MSRDIQADVAAIVRSRATAGATDDAHRPIVAAYDPKKSQQAEADPLLSALIDARTAQQEAASRIRRLVAYGREFVRPRPYRLADLAEVSGMSISGVRTGYDHYDVDAVADLTGARPSEWQAQDTPEPTDDDALEEIFADLRRRVPEHAYERVREVAVCLRHDGWSPHAPSPRAPGTKAAKRHVRWDRLWPNGTRFSLYQEAGMLVASRKVDDSDADRCQVDYASTDSQLVLKQVRALMRRIDLIDEGGDEPTT